MHMTVSPCRAEMLNENAKFNSFLLVDKVGAVAGLIKFVLISVSLLETNNYCKSDILLRCLNTLI